MEKEDAVCRGDEKDAANLLSGLNQEDRKAESLSRNGSVKVWLPCAGTGDRHVFCASTRLERGATIDWGGT